MTLARMGEVLSSPACMVLSETTGIDAGKAMICLRWDLVVQSLEGRATTVPRSLAGGP